MLSPVMGWSVERRPNVARAVGRCLGDETVARPQQNGVAYVSGTDGMGIARTCGHPLAADHRRTDEQRVRQAVSRAATAGARFRAPVAPCACPARGALGGVVPARRLLPRSADLERT